MVYVGIYALIYLHTILGEGIVSRDGLPRGALPSGILKMEKYCPGHKVPVSSECYIARRTKERWICPDRQATWRLYIVIQQMILVSRQYLLDLGYSSKTNIR